MKEGPVWKSHAVMIEAGHVDSPNMDTFNSKEWFWNRSVFTERHAFFVTDAVVVSDYEFGVLLNTYAPSRGSCRNS